MSPETSAIEPSILNIRDAAAFLGVHEETVRRLARRAVLPSFKVGRDWRFRRDALLRWSEKQAGSSGQPSLLVVDDEPLSLGTLARMAARLGWEARQAGSALDGLRLVRQRPPDVILLDLFMPDMNGIEFLAELRVSHSDLPVVIITGQPDSELVNDAARYAPVMLLAKPIEAALLERTLGAVVPAKEQRR
jgi:excisionase family DNA binding protein